MIKIALVGAGKRMKNMNIPILKQQDRVEIVGVTTKSGALKEDVGLEVPVYSSIDEMFDEVDPELVYVSVPHTSTHKVLMELINYNVPILVDTPLSLNIDLARDIAFNAKQKGVTIGVVEEWPYLPIECFKKKIVDSGVIGSVVAVENDYRTYDYHGPAQLRNYLPKNVRPVRAQQDGLVCQMPKHQTKDGNIFPESTDVWRVSIIKFNNGTLCINKYSSIYKKVDFRISNSLRIYGQKGTIIADCLLSGEFNFSILDEEGVSHSLKLKKEYSENSTIKSLSVELPNGEQISWVNPYKDMLLNEYQVGIVQHIGHMLDFIATGGDKKILYTTSDFLYDLHLFYGKVF
jgi:predicted dehydrogenase